MITYIFTAFMLLTAQSIQAQSKPKDIADKFFIYFESDADKALDYAFGTNEWMQRKKESVEELKQKFSRLKSMIGTYHGYEEINYKKTGKSLMVYTFIVKFDRQPLRFTMVFYKPEDVWQVQNIEYDDNLDSDMIEAAKRIPHLLLEQ